MFNRFAPSLCFMLSAACSASDISSDIAWQAYVQLSKLMQTGSCEDASFRYICKDDLVEALDIAREYHKSKPIQMLKADFACTVLEDVDFSYIDLTGSSFILSKLVNVRFDHSCLNYSTMSSSEFHNVNFSCADLTAVSMNNSILDGVNFSGAILCRTELRFPKLVGSLLFDHAVIKSAKLQAYNFAITNYIKSSKGVILKD